MFQSRAPLSWCGLALLVGGWRVVGCRGEVPTSDEDEGSSRSDECKDCAHDEEHVERAGKARTNGSEHDSTQRGRNVGQLPDIALSNGSGDVVNVAIEGGDSGEILGQPIPQRGREQ